MPGQPLTEEQRRLVAANLGLARKAADMFANGRTSFDERRSAAYVGLCKAAQRFDPSRGVKFSTYATEWALAAIKGEFARADLCRNRPFRPENLRDPSTLYDLADAEYDVADAIDRRLLLGRLEAAIQQLPAVERHVIRRRLAGETQRDISREIALTRQRTCQIEAEARRRLQRILAAGRPG